MEDMQVTCLSRSGQTPGLAVRGGVSGLLAATSVATGLLAAALLTAACSSAATSPASSPGFAGEQRSGVRHIDGLALQAGNA